MSITRYNNTTIYIQNVRGNNFCINKYRGLYPSTQVRILADRPSRDRIPIPRRRYYYNIMIVPG